ncbi:MULTISPECIES: hypothetical protein [Rhodonellum]|nr:MULTISPECIES: hypothetical protein [Rhodonellum]
MNTTMKMINKGFLAMVLLSFVFLYSSCTSEDPEEENEEELITDVTLKFTEVNPAGEAIGTPFNVKAIDNQGLGLGTTPTIETITLIKGKRYMLEIELFNSIENEDITKEIKEEADEHQFYFLGTAFVGSAPLTYTYADEGSELVGLKGFVAVAQNPGFNNATFRLVLRHDLNKSFPGANNPSFENFIQAGGETDLDIVFPLVLN